MSKDTMVNDFHNIENQNFIDQLPKLIETFKNDKHAQELLSKLGDHLEQNANERRINEAAQEVFDFKNTKVPVFKSMNEPTCFLDGFDKAASLVAFFFSIIYKSDCPAKVKDFLLVRLNQAIETANEPGYVPLHRRVVIEKETAEANTILSVVAEMRRKGIEDTLHNLKDRRRHAEAALKCFDKVENAKEEAELRSQLAQVNAAYDKWKSNNVLPEEFEILSMFEGQPKMQFVFNIKTLQSEIDECTSAYDDQLRKLKLINTALDEYQRELDDLSRVDHIEPNMNVA